MPTTAPHFLVSTALMAAVTILLVSLFGFYITGGLPLSPVVQSVQSPITLWTSSPNMRVATYNLRYDSQSDNITVRESLEHLPDPLARPGFLRLSGEQPWSLRRTKVASQLLSEAPTVIGFQEALLRQVNDLQELMGDDWAWVGVGRDDGHVAGEFSPIFYNSSAVQLVSWNSFWLSNTPFEPSRYPGAGSHRVCTVAHFQTIPTAPTVAAIRFTMLNTHLDDRSDEQRRVGAALMLARARYEAHAHGAPVFVTGDFNSASDGWDSGAYQVATGSIAPPAINETFAEKYAVPEDALPNFVLQDLRAYTPKLRITGDFATFTGFSRPGDAHVYTRIDFVFGGSNGDWKAEAYKTVSALTDDGVLASDHRPVFVDISL